VIRNTRGSVFSMCERGLAGEPGYAKYPPVPVVRCAGFEPRPRDPRSDLSAIAHGVGEADRRDRSP